MHTRLPAPKAAELLLRFVLLGPSKAALSRLRITDPNAARQFDTQIADALKAVGDRDDITPLDLMTAVYGRLEGLLKGRADDFLAWVRTQIDTYAARAEPYKPFDEMVTVALTATAGLYGADGPHPAELGDLPALLVWENLPPGSFGFAHGVSACLECVPGCDPQLVIKVCPRDFDRDCILALPYVLFHEYVCHAARLLATGELRSTPGSPFAEGWMDYVALELHNDVVRRSRPANRVWIDPSGHRDSAVRLHDARHATPDHDDQIANGRAFGRNTASRVDHLFPGTRRLPRPLWRLSARLNASALDDETLDDFVRDVDRALERADIALRLGRLLRDPGLTSEQLVERASAIIA